MNLELLASIVDSSDDAILSTTLDGIITSWNAGAESLYGYSAEEIVGRHVSLLVPSDRSTEIDSILDAIREGRRVATFATTRLRKGGGTVAVSLTVSPIHDSEGLVVGASSIARDITEVKKVKARFEGLLQAAPDAMLGVRANGTIAFVNHQAETLFGYDEHELLGRPVEMLVPQHVRQAHPGHRAKYCANPEVRPMGAGLDLAGRRKDSTEFPAEISLSSIDTEEGLLVTAAVRDVTERKRTERWLEAIRDIAGAILSGGDVDDVLQLITSCARGLVGADLATIAIPVEGRAELRLTTADGAHAEEIRGTLVPLEGSISGEVFRGQHTIVVTDASTDPRSHLAAVKASRTGPSICVPLSVRGVAFGTLGVANTAGGRAFGDDDVRMVQSFAEQASLGLEYGRAHREILRLSVVEDRERIAKDLHDGVIQALFAVGLTLQGTASILADNPAGARIQEAVNEVDRVIGDLRNYIFGLRPGVLIQGRLAEALEQLAHEFQGRSGVTTVIEVDETIEAPLAEQSVHIVQFVREALSNVGRHAGAETCRVSLRRQGSTAVLEIDDDGRGFDVDAARGRGMGLGNLEGRARSIGGSLRISSRTGEGTTVRITIPA